MQCIETFEAAKVFRDKFRPIFPAVYNENLSNRQPIPSINPQEGRENDEEKFDLPIVEMDQTDTDAIENLLILNKGFDNDNGKNVGVGSELDILNNKTVEDIVNDGENEVNMQNSIEQNQIELVSHNDIAEGEADHEQNSNTSIDTANGGGSEPSLEQINVTKNAAKLAANNVGGDDDEANVQESVDQIAVDNSCEDHESVCGDNQSNDSKLISEDSPVQNSNQLVGRGHENQLSVVDPLEENSNEFLDVANCVGPEHLLEQSNDIIINAAELSVEPNVRTNDQPSTSNSFHSTYKLDLSSKLSVTEDGKIHVTQVVQAGILEMTYVLGQKIQPKTDKSRRINVKSNDLLSGNKPFQENVSFHFQHIFQFQFIT